MLCVSYIALLICCSELFESVLCIPAYKYNRRSFVKCVLTHLKKIKTSYNVWSPLSLIFLNFLRNFKILFGDGRDCVSGGHHEAPSDQLYGEQYLPAEGALGMVYC